eukprot:GFYU01014874.1.p1 GENE.GFYU01014874.1~~GFYU01014874.1.p1  ORF type:complete len:184 (-),score=50.37 GFYU01014874.1:83-592(-)
MACALDFYAAFYDKWVSRDIQGRQFDEYYPWVFEPYSNYLVRNDQPFRVYACWNGVVVMDAKPFRKHRTKFRYSRIWDGEEYNSECFLIGKDFWNSGYTRIWVNPLVRVTYEEKDYWIQNFLFPVYLNPILGFWKPYPDITTSQYDAEKFQDPNLPPPNDLDIEYWVPG